MTQHSFDFASEVNRKVEEDHKEEIQKWVTKHNQQVAIAARTPNVPVGSLLGAIDQAEAKANAVYLLRGVISQVLRKSMGSESFPSRRKFIQSLRAEMSIKKTSHNPAFSLRDILIKVHSSF